jgi:hypothetical protein
MRGYLITRTISARKSSLKASITSPVPMDRTTRELDEREEPVRALTTTPESKTISGGKG